METPEPIQPGRLGILINPNTSDQPGISLLWTPGAKNMVPEDQLRAIEHRHGR
jgi:hypothetical protein